MVTSLELNSKGREGWFGYRLPYYSGKWRNHFSQIFNVHGHNDFRQTEIHTADAL